jgi:hypothetical protein
MVFFDPLGAESKRAARQRTSQKILLRFKYSRSGKRKRKKKTVELSDEGGFGRSAAKRGTSEGAEQGL